MNEAASDKVNVFVDSRAGGERCRCSAILIVCDWKRAKRGRGSFSPC